jgi:diguanylate cyclase (GGDEF)-like protein/putative nucleotidyltransferase with HDIG domain
MAGFQELRLSAKSYVAVVVFGGVLVLGQSLHHLYTFPIDPKWFVFAGLTLLTGSFTVKVPSINASLSVSETFVFASVLLFGASAGAVTVLLECLIILFWMKPGRSIHKILFNTAAPAIAIWVSGTAFFLMGGFKPYAYQVNAVPLRELFLPLLAFTLLYFLLNSWLVAVALGFETQESPARIWWDNFTWLAVNYFSGASVAALIVTYMRDDDVSTLAIIVPLLVVSYLTFRTAMGRVEDSNKHLSELNRLYLSTIETLAMAIDAKDQITHGHIRRVQAYAVGLAKRMGVADQKLIKAIEAAALLHDMGKLAVPEYILNKPGRLTGAEFEKMKLHASIGADILSAIDFPYPVVPIVRYHHENWDGTGYPCGLKGTEIPIGARILSVVDCFDALTSDRPYRPRLPDEDALNILSERSGTMYDPLIVETFGRVYLDIAPEIAPNKLPRHVLNEITSSTHPTPLNESHSHFDDIAASADEMFTLYELAHALAGQASINDTGDILAKHLRRLIPFAQSILFLYDAATDELEACHTLGHASSAVRALRIPLGQRLSGWVAANRNTIVNSDATLDLGDVARSLTPRLRSSLSSCLMLDGQLIGVLTLYSEQADAFNDDHRRVLEVVARQISHTVKRAAEFDNGSRRDAITGLPNLKHLQQVLESGEDPLTTGSDVTLLLIDVVGLKEINSRHGREAGDEVLRHISRHARSGLRLADILCRNGSDEFVALLNKTDAATATVVAERVQHNIRNHMVRLSGGASLTVETNVTCVSAPKDGDSLQDLLACAQLRAVNPEHPSQVH